MFCPWRVNVVCQVRAGFISRVSGGYQKPHSHGGLPHNVWVHWTAAQPSQHRLIVPDAWFCSAPAIRTGWVVPLFMKLRTPSRNFKDSWRNRPQNELNLSDTVSDMIPWCYNVHSSSGLEKYLHCKRIFFTCSLPINCKAAQWKMYT